MIHWDRLTKEECMDMIIAFKDASPYYSFMVSTMVSTTKHHITREDLENRIEVKVRWYDPD